MKCSICGRKAVAQIRYARLSLCREHFSDYIIRKVKKLVDKYNLFDRDSRILVAVSGGKDSLALLDILYKMFSREKTRNIYALFIDLGIGDYSRKSREVVEKYTRERNIPLIIVDVRELLGVSILELAKKAKRPTCSVCGVVKRYIMNAVAIELNAVVATGHNLDDIAAYIFKEFLQQKLENIKKLAPVVEGINDIAAKKVRPLYEVYEKETLTYVLINKLEYVIDECPFVNRDSLERNIKKYLNELEYKFPGIKIGFIRSFEKKSQCYPSPSGSVNKCRVCGLISSTDVCSYCRLTAKALGKPMGLETRKYIREKIYSLFKEG